MLPVLFLKFGTNASNKGTLKILKKFSGYHPTTSSKYKNGITWPGYNDTSL